MDPPGAAFMDIEQRINLVNHFTLTNNGNKYA